MSAHKDNIIEATNQITSHFGAYCRRPDFYAVKKILDQNFSPLACDYRVAVVNGRPVIMLRKFNVVVAEFAENTASAVDFFTEILGT